MRTHRNSTFLILSTFAWSKYIVVAIVIWKGQRVFLKSKNPCRAFGGRVLHDGNGKEGYNVRVRLQGYWIKEHEFRAGEGNGLAISRRAPIKLKRVLLVDSPFILKGFMKLLEVFLKKKTADMMVVCYS